MRPTQLRRHTPSWNLGCDDRLIADHRSKGRPPFLDEQLMAALLDTPVHVMADVGKAKDMTSMPVGCGTSVLPSQWRVLPEAVRYSHASTLSKTICYMTRIDVRG